MKSGQPHINSRTSACPALDAGDSILNVLCREHRIFGRRSKNPEALRLPLRHEMGDFRRLGSGERNPPKAEARGGPSKRERASHWAGVRWCLGFRGRSIETWFLQSILNVESSLSLFCTLTFLLLSSVAAQAQISREYQLKAVFLYNFAQFTEWPTNVFADDKSPIVIGIVGTDPFDGVFRTPFAMKTWAATR